MRDRYAIDAAYSYLSEERAQAAGLEQVVTKAAEAFTGRAELTVKLDTGALVAFVEGIVKHGLAGLNTTGIGSTGQSDTNVDQHRRGDRHSTAGGADHLNFRRRCSEAFTSLD